LHGIFWLGRTKSGNGWWPKAAGLFPFESGGENRGSGLQESVPGSAMESGGFRPWLALP